MPASFPCPNPACTHVFPPEAVRGAAALTCPGCGHHFQLRSGPAPAGPLPPAEEPADDLVPPADFIPSRARRSRRRSKWGATGYVLLALAVLLVAGLAGAGWALRGRLLAPDRQEQTAGPTYTVPQHNFSFRAPPPPWRPDERTRLGLHTGIALRRTEPDAWLAILSNDYKGRTPGDAEMAEEALHRLKGYFKEDFQWEPRPDGELAGRRAQRIAFVGTVDGAGMAGDCTMLAADGFGYWFLTWAPQGGAGRLADQWDGIRAGFTLGKGRDGE